MFQLGKIRLFTNPVGMWFLLGAGAAAFSIDLLESASCIDGDFETYAALVYGKCEILPDHTDRCEIGIGPLFTKASCGRLDSVVAAKTGKSLRYFDLTTWKLRGEPGGQRAAFRTWSLWHNVLTQSGSVCTAPRLQR